jgi:hypothetical protein
MESSSAASSTWRQNAYNADIAARFSGVNRMKANARLEALFFVICSETPEFTTPSD